MAYNQDDDDDDYLLVKVDNQSNIQLININQCNNHHVTSVKDNLKSSSSSSTPQPPPPQPPPPPSSSSSSYKPLENGPCELTNLIRDKLKLWIDSLGIQSAEAQNLKEPITCHTRFIQGSFRSNSPLKHKDLIYFLVQYQTINYNHQRQRQRQHQQPSSTIVVTDEVDDKKTNQSSEYNKRIQLTAVGFIRIGFRNLFLQHDEQLVNVNQCFSILDFYVTRQRQGLGKLLISCVLKDQTININKCAFDRPTQAMLSFLGKHFNLGSPRKQHNRFVIYNGFFT